MLDDEDKKVLRSIYTEAIEAWHEKLTFERNAEAAAGRFSIKLQECMDFLRQTFRACYPESAIAVDLMVGKGMIPGFTVVLRTGDSEDVFEIQLAASSEEKQKKIVIV